MTGTDITPYAAEPLSERIAYAEVLARADLIPKSLWTPNRNDDQGRLIPSRPSVGNVLLVMEHGAMLDLHPMAAINGIFIIEGKASMSANLMSAVVRGKGYTLRVVTEGEWGPTFKAVATLVRPDDPDFTYRVEWTEAKAKRAELTGKDNWKKYPEAMAKARAISEVIREGATDALNGIGYTPEELGANVTESGEIIDGEIVEDAPAPSAMPPARKRATNGRQGTKRAKAPAEDAEAPSEPPAAAETVVVHEKTDAPTPDEAAAVPASPTVDVNTAKAADALKGESEADYQWRKRIEREAEEMEREERANIAAEQTKAAEAESEPAEETPAEVDARIKAERAARTKAPAEEAQAEVKAEAEPWADEPHPFDVVSAEQPEAWELRLDAATTEAQVRTVWDQATAAKAMTTELRLIVVKAKARVTA